MNCVYCGNACSVTQQVIKNIKCIFSNQCFASRTDNLQTKFLAEAIVITNRSRCSCETPPISDKAPGKYVEFCMCCDAR